MNSDQSTSNNGNPQKKHKKSGFRGPIVFYATVFLLFTCTFISSFHSPLFVKQTVLFYRGLKLLMAATSITVAISTLLNRYFFKLQQQTLLAAILVSFSFHLSFFIVFPVTFDRSITMYLLSTLKEKSASHTCGGLSKKSLEQYFVDEYILKSKAIDRRIQEQSIINFIKEEESCVRLTTKGNNFLNLSELIKKMYSLKQ